MAELCNLTVCCYIPLLDGSAIILILEAKNNRDLAACLSKVFIAPAMHHLRQFPSAAAFLRLVYIPLIVRLGVRRHPACTTNVDSVHRCQVCPKLFPTFPRDGRPTGTMSKSNITEEIRQWLSALGVPGDQLQQYSGISLRRATATMAAMMKVAPETSLPLSASTSVRLPSRLTLVRPTSRSSPSMKTTTSAMFAREACSVGSCSAASLARKQPTCAA